MEKTAISTNTFLEREMTIFNEMYYELFDFKEFDETPILNDALKHAKGLVGKRVRPRLVFLFAKLNGAVTESTYHIALCLELIHLASLSHDDVIDNSDLRRGKETFRKKWNNKISILLGDYLLTKSLFELEKVIREKGNTEIFYSVLKVISGMIKGEFYQMYNALKIDLSEDKYYRTNALKTGTLIENCCTLGYLSNNSPYNNGQDSIRLIKKIGRGIGDCFQLQDDILDYSNNALGKQKFKDLKEKKLTLPLLLSLKNSSSIEKKEYIDYLQQNGTLEGESLRHMLSFIKAKNGITQSKKTLSEMNDSVFLDIEKLPDSLEKDKIQDFLMQLFNRTF